MLLLSVLVGIAVFAPAQAATPHTTNRPRQFIAYSELAVVRLAATYYADTTVNGQSALTLAGTCTGLGTIIGTTGNGGNTRNFVLTDAQVVSPSQPCAGLQNAYLNANKTPPTRWRLTEVRAYLNSAYTSDDASKVGSVSFDLDISSPTLGLSTGPMVLPLVTTNAPTTDLPIIPVPTVQPAPTATTQLLDLGSGAQPYTQDLITTNVIPSVLTPIETNATSPAFLATPTGTVTPSASATVTLNTTPTAAPAISPGAPLVSDVGDGTAALVGMVMMTNKGLSLVGVPALDSALAAATAVSRPGTFDQDWHAGLSAYYAASPTNAKDAHYATATAQFTTLQQQYPAFTGVAPWLSAAQVGSPIPGTTAAPVSSPPGTTTPATDIIPGVPIHSMAELIALIAAVVVLILGVFFLVRVLTLRRKQAAQARLGATDDADITAKSPAVRNGNNGRRAPLDSVPLTQRSTALTPTLPLAKSRHGLRLGHQAAGLTDVGIRRKASPNQDSILAVQGARMHEGAPQAFGLFAVADGMGGHQFGREASQEAIRVLAEHVLQPLLSGDPLDDEAMLQLIKGGVEHANIALHYRNVRQHSDSGTTITATLVAGDMAFVVNVGDSRTYFLQRDQPLRQVTVDHSVVASLVLAGVIEPDDVYTHPKRSQIYRSLGEQEEIQVDTFDVPLQSGDHLLLCSDGLWEMVRNPRLEDILRQRADLGYVTEMLIDEANENGGVDNISAIVIRVLGEEATPRQIGMHILAGPPSLKGV
jgi:serine/threonine protein phosphatase PrpC